MILDGKSISIKLTNDLKNEIDKLNTKLRLDIIQIGDNEGCKRYISQKEKKAKELGVVFKVHYFGYDVSEEEILKLIDELNYNKEVNGIIVQLPLPKNINFDNVRNRINPNKDIDGMNDINIGKLVVNNKCLVPCTSLGIMKLLDEYKIDLVGKRVCIIGRSVHIGRSLANLMCNRDATVTLCHSKTKNLNDIIRNSDIVIIAVGKSNFVTNNMISKGTCIIDVGFNFVDGKICGDVDYNNVVDLCSYITPVPGGVGPMTVYSIYENLLEAYKLNK